MMTLDTRTVSAPRAAVDVVTQSAVHCGALLRAWLRDPGVIIQALVFPAFLLIMFQVVFGKSTTAIGAGQSIFGNAGLVALVGAMQGTMLTGVALINDRDSGLLSRLWTLPVPRSGFLLGRILAEAVRILAGTVVLLVFAMTMGFRFEQGLLAGLGAVLIPVLFGVAWAWVVIALATVSGKAQIQYLGVLFLVLLFFNTGFAPATEYPGWLQPIVEYQPMSPAIDTMVGLAEGGPIASPLSLTICWAVAISAVFGVLAARGYRRAVQG
ncbi:ABC transporter permease [Gordonia sp. CPCC 205333]|uniref:ABC transporter permease n=1 Tax=Gordonia sp. CPCC 205333 TaxID=3140790 RepID=UPI003AF35EA6